MQALVAGIVDYAGMFPPAKLDPQTTVENFARDRMGTHAFMQGRLVWPASKIDHLDSHGAALMPGTYATSGYREHADIGEPWRITLVGDLPIDECVRTINAFNEKHSIEQHGLAIIDSLETKLDSSADIDDLIDTIPDDVYPFFEINWRQDPRGLIAALAGTESAAKIRTGGVTPDAFPTSEAVAAFVSACALANVPFKATAGLHHPIRAEYRLTYEDNPPCGTMHGFVNLFLGAAMLHALRLEPDVYMQILNETDASAFSFDDNIASWRDRTISVEQIAHARERLCMSFGSCSFAEPVEDLTRLGWL